jgi:hypothetical protein
MSKLDIGVGDEFPLEEGQPEERGPGRHQGRGRHRHRHGRHGHHGHHHFRHGRRGLLHLPLFLGVAAIAALIGAGKIPVPATHVILALAGVAILLALIAHFVHHRRHAQ